jgi:hypothetical protein
MGWKKILDQTNTLEIRSDQSGGGLATLNADLYGDFSSNKLKGVRFNGGEGIDILGSYSTLSGNILTISLDDDDVCMLDDIQTLTNKTLTSPNVNSAFIGEAGMYFEGTTVDDFETQLKVEDPSADNVITLPDATGDVVLNSTLQDYAGTGVSITHQGVISANAHGFAASDPGSSVDKILYWNNSESECEWLSLESGLSVTETGAGLHQLWIRPNALVADTENADMVIVGDTNYNRLETRNFTNFGSDIEGYIDHNSLSNYEADRHIMWTSATEDFRTTGKVTVGDKLIMGSIIEGNNGNVEIYSSSNSGIEYFSLSGSTIYSTKLEFDSTLSGNTTITVPATTGTMALTSDITMTDLSDDTTPSLGGDLNLADRDITGSGDILFTPSLETTTTIKTSYNSPSLKTLTIECENTHALGTSSIKLEADQLTGSCIADASRGITSDDDTVPSTKNVHDAMLRVQSSPPLSATASGTKGDAAFNSSYLFICTATDTWKRVAISTW